MAGVILRGNIKNCPLAPRTTVIERAKLDKMPRRAIKVPKFEGFHGLTPRENIPGQSKYKTSEGHISANF